MNNLPIFGSGVFQRQIITTLATHLSNVISIADSWTKSTYPYQKFKTVQTQSYFHNGDDSYTGKIVLSYCPSLPKGHSSIPYVLWRNAFVNINPVIWWLCRLLPVGIFTILCFDIVARVLSCIWGHPRQKIQIHDLWRRLIIKTNNGVCVVCMAMLYSTHFMRHKYSSINIKVKWLMTPSLLESSGNQQTTL